MALLVAALLATALQAQCLLLASLLQLLELRSCFRNQIAHASLPRILH